MCSPRCAGCECCVAGDTTPGWSGYTSGVCRRHDLDVYSSRRRIQRAGQAWQVSISHFYLGKSRYCVCCLTIATKQSGDDIHDLRCCHLRCWRSLFSEYCIRPWIVFYNITRAYNCIFGALPPIQHFSSEKCPLMMQNELLRPTSLLHRSLLSSDFRQVPRRNFIQFFPFLVHCCFRCRNFHSLRHKNKFVILVLLWIVSFSCILFLMTMRYRISHTHSRRFISFQNIRKFCLNFVGRPTPTIFHTLQGIAGATDVNFLRAFLMVSLNSLSSRSDGFLAIFVRYRGQAFHLKTFASPSAWHAFPLTSRALVIDDLTWMKAVFSLVSTQTTYILQEVFLPIEKIVWILSKDQTSLLTNRYSESHRCVSLAWHPTLYE